MWPIHCAHSFSSSSSSLQALLLEHFFLVDLLGGPHPWLCSVLVALASLLCCSEMFLSIFGYVRRSVTVWHCSMLIWRYHFSTFASLSIFNDMSNSNRASEAATRLVAVAKTEWRHTHTKVLTIAQVGAEKKIKNLKTQVSRSSNNMFPRCQTARSVGINCSIDPITHTSKLSLATWHIVSPICIGSLKGWRREAT